MNIKKTQEGLISLFLNSIKVDCIFAADPIELKFYKSKIRTSLKGLKFEHPSNIAKKLKIPYHVIVHNSEDCENLIKKYDLDLGIILGARILKPKIIKAFKIGIINMHPGLLPECRGLDAMKWAILKNYKQGVSCHLISKEIDKGQLLSREEIDVFEDDTLVDINLRLQNLQYVMLVDCIKGFFNNSIKTKVLPEGNYFKSVPPEEEKNLLFKFENYKKNYYFL